ncbi:MAG: putative rhamnosyl transferase [Acidiferrobacterales bacterium]|nr:putative rhamnosyl transferase [Acidiferrobacterales bacterium]
MSNSDILHVILTRFNLPSGGREKRIRQSPGWLENRFELFEKFCLPSVQNQTNQRFKWFIYFDQNTPEPFRSRAINIENAYSNITLFWVGSLSLKDINEQILGLKVRDTSKVLTTRLDNDDALNKHFIATLQNQANLSTDDSLRAGKAVILNFTHGLVLCEKRTYSHSDSSNAFASMLEPLSENLQTIWRRQHNRLSLIGEFVQIDKPDMWMQVVHGNNVSNRIKGYRILNRSIEPTFPFKVSNTRESKFYVCLENLTLYPLRAIKERIRSIIKLVYSAILTKS